MQDSDAGLLYLLFAACAYFAPSLVAYQRSHKSVAAIFVLNILLGWTILGWIGALVWSFNGNTNQKIVIGHGWNRRVVDETALRIKVLEAQLRAAEGPKIIEAQLQSPEDCYRKLSAVPEPKPSDPAYWSALDRVKLH